MNKTLLILSMTLLLLVLVVSPIVKALTITGDVEFIPSLANTTFKHYGVSTGVEQITVESDSINFNTIGKDIITLTAVDHGTDNVYFNYDTIGKKLYINITKTTGTVSLSGSSALGDSTLHMYEVDKDGYLFDAYLSEPTYVFNGVGEYIIKALSTIDELGDYTYNYDTDVHETERVSWNITVPLTIAQQFYEVHLTNSYNYEYTPTYIDDGLHRTYTAEFNIPTNMTADINMSNWWRFRSYDSGSIESERFNTSVTILDIKIMYDASPFCDAGGDTNLLIYFKQENNPSVNIHNLTDSIEYEIEYWYGDNGGQTVITENYASVPHLEWYEGWCSLETNYHYNIYATVEVQAPDSIDPLNPPLVTTVQTCDASNCTSNSTTIYTYAENTFTQRIYLWDIHTSLAWNEVSPYLIMNSTDYITREVILIDSNTLNKIEDVYVMMDRYYLDEGVWRTVQFDKTDAQGKAIFYVKEAEADYRFKFADEDGVVYETTSRMHFSCANDFCQTTFFTDPSSIDTTVRPTLDLDISYDNNTEVIKSQWFVTDGRTLSVNTQVIKHTTTGDLILCDETTDDTSDRHYCDVGAHRGIIDVIVRSVWEEETKIEQT